MTDRSGTCNVACWQAKEPDCRCMCGGKNHSIMSRQDGRSQPGRQTQRKTGVYDLVAVCDNWTEANKAGEEAEKERGLIGSWRNPAILLESATGHTLKWPEVQAVHASRTNPYSNTVLVWVKSLPTPAEATPEPS